MTFKRILIAVDEAPFARHTLDTAFDMAEAMGAEVALVNVISPASLVAEGSASMNQLVAAAQQDSKRRLDEIARGNPQAATQFTPVGDPGAEIVAAARSWPADLVVVSTHGRKGRARALLGSVAEHVMRNAPCPVLSVKEKE